MPVPHHLVFTGLMPFLPPNQQRKRTEGNEAINYNSQTIHNSHTQLLFKQPSVLDSHSKSAIIIINLWGYREQVFFYADSCHQTKRIKALKATHSTNINHEGKLSLQQIFHSHFLMFI